ncbi:MAG: OmpA family protein [Desulfobacteraceae bacterium]|nr:OmpA family protein [Desulfobacteraceae bacterium]
MGDQRAAVIIKKVKKADHGGSHGGSWKVAYADFVTAMMAFFLLLWLVSMVSPDKKARVSQYFKEYSLFEKSGSSIMDLGDPANVQIANPEGLSSTGPAKEFNEDKEGEGFQARFMESLRKEIESKLSDLKDQILVQSFDNGVRVEIMDKEGSPMFPLSSTEMSEDGKKILKVVAQTLEKDNHPIAIEGHTDARAFPSMRYSNWELSTARASVARIELEKAGLPSNRLVRVAGFASTQPLIANNPMDPKNRRISILVFK